MNFYEFSWDSKSDNITIIQKYTEKDLDETLENLKICHLGRFILILKKSEKFLNTEILDKYIGGEFQPINLSIVFLNKDIKFKTYNNIKLNDFKDLIKKYFNVNCDIEINLKSSNKNISLDNIGYDKKNSCYLNLKQLKINDKSILIVSKSKQNENDEYSLNILDGEKKLEENTSKVSNIVCLEDDRDNPQIIRTKLNKTFEDFIKKITKKFSLTGDINIRLRK